jgi:hypothetical protein
MNPALFSNNLLTNSAKAGYFGDANTITAVARRLKHGFFTPPPKIILPEEGGVREAPAAVIGGRTSSGIFCFGGPTMKKNTRNTSPTTNRPAISKSSGKNQAKPCLSPAGKIMPIRPGEPLPKKRFPFFSMDDEAATLFPDLAGEERKARAAIGLRLSKEEQRRMSQVEGKYFAVMEQVLAHLHRNDNALYEQAMKSYLFMKLWVQSGVVARNDLLHVFLLLGKGGGL